MPLFPAKNEFQHFYSSRFSPYLFSFSLFINLSEEKYYEKRWKNPPTTSFVHNLVGIRHVNNYKCLLKFLDITPLKIISSFWLVNAHQFFPVSTSKPCNFFQNVVGTLDPEFGW